MTKAILIDVDNTLLDFRRGSHEAATRACAEYGVTLDPRMLDEFDLTTKLLWQKVEEGRLTVDELLKTRWNIIFEHCGVRGVDGEKVESVFHECLQTSAILIDGADDALAYLSESYPVYVASNAPAGQQQRRMRLAGLDKYICGYFISEEMGASKPSAAFFDEVFCTLDLYPKDAVMIGDSPSADIYGAKALGMTTVLFDPERRYADVPTDHIINSLDRLKTIL